MSADAELIQIVDAAVAEAQRRSAGWLHCRRGCQDCCIGPFAITSLDAARLRQGFAELYTTDPERAQRLQARANEASVALHGDAVLQLEDEAAEDAFHQDHASLPCPVLDLETGACELYAHRPIACRLHGPAMRVDGVNLRHCCLNYVGATVAEVEAMRVSLVPGEVADRAVEELGGVNQRTYVALALSQKAYR